MKKLIKGIIDFRHNVLDNYRESFAKLALQQSPDSLFIACSDSRVVPNLFASTNPGDLFVLRNVGNMIAPCGPLEHSTGDEAEAAALEFAITTLHISNIIVCGHSECGAMSALTKDRNSIQMPHLKNWLRHGEGALDAFSDKLITPAGMALHNQVSQRNVLLQIEHLKTYPIIQKALTAGRISIHGWWFDIARADVYAFEKEFKKFVVIDDAEAARILATLE